MQNLVSGILAAILAAAFLAPAAQGQQCGVSIDKISTVPVTPRSTTNHNPFTPELWQSFTVDDQYVLDQFTIYTGCRKVENLTSTISFTLHEGEGTSNPAIALWNAVLECGVSSLAYLDTLPPAFKLQSHGRYTISFRPSIGITVGLVYPYGGGQTWKSSRGSDIIFKLRGTSPCPTESPTLSPTPPTTAEPTLSPTTLAPSASPTSTPTMSPSPLPTTGPTLSPVTAAPSASPSTSPSLSPTPPTTLGPSISPTIASPSASPSVSPTNSPTHSPSVSPTTHAPTNSPTDSPTGAPVCGTVYTDARHTPEYATKSISTRSAWQSFVPKTDGVLYSISWHMTCFSGRKSFSYTIYEGEGTNGKQLISWGSDQSRLCSLSARFMASPPAPKTVFLKAGVTYTVHLTGRSSFGLSVTHGGDLYNDGRGGGLAWWREDYTDDYLFVLRMVTGACSTDSPTPSPTLMPSRSPTTNPTPSPTCNNTFVVASTNRRINGWVSSRKLVQHFVATQSGIFHTFAFLTRCGSRGSFNFTLYENDMPRLHWADETVAGCAGDMGTIISPPPPSDFHIDQGGSYAIRVFSNDGMFTYPFNTLSEVRREGVSQYQVKAINKCE